MDSRGIGPEWIEVNHIDLELQNLPLKLHGLRIAHISDLHCSSTVSGGYLRRCIERVNMLDVDIVVLTGDYITYDFRGRYREKVVGLLGNIESRLGIYACLGNHDYGVKRSPADKRRHLLGRMTQGMQDKGINVLRNEASALDINGHRLWIVGLGDLWVDDFHPHKAFKGVPTDHPSIALVHNPRGVEHLGSYPVNAIMSGHTHGRKTTVATWPTQTPKDRLFHSGMYDVQGKKLYVNRGLGRHGRARFNARPEITIFTLC